MAKLSNEQLDQIIKLTEEQGVGAALREISDIQTRKILGLPDDAVVTPVMRGQAMGKGYAEGFVSDVRERAEFFAKLIRENPHLSEVELGKKFEEKYGLIEG